MPKQKRDFKALKKEFIDWKQLPEIISSVDINIAPIEKIINQAKAIENAHLLIKNNGGNFEVSSEEKELINLLK